MSKLRIYLGQAPTENSVAYELFGTEYFFCNPARKVLVQMVLEQYLKEYHRQKADHYREIDQATNTQQPPTTN